MPPTSPNSPASSRDGIVSDDGLAHLYKMSRTAGLGSQDYVAINPVAVAAIIFGIASILVVVDPVLLAVPVVGLVLSIMAIRQVRNSSGTQTGGALAGVALLLSVGFLGFKVVGQSVQSIRLSNDKKEVNALIADVGKDLTNLTPESIADAYSRFGSKFTARVPQEKFAAVWLSVRSSPFYGAMKSMHSNGQIKIDTDATTGESTGVGIVIAEFEHGESPRWTMTFRRSDRHWNIEDMPEVFPIAPPAAPAANKAR